MFSWFRKKEKKMASVTINGKTFESEGGNISITSRNGQIIVNGNVFSEGLSGTVHLKIEGAVANIEADGGVDCRDVAGYARAGGSIHCGNVGGNVSAGGSVHAGAVTGNISAGGSVKVSRG